MVDFRNTPQHGRWWDIKDPEKKFNGTLKLGEDDIGELIIRGKEHDLRRVEGAIDPTIILGHLTSEPMLEISVLGPRRTRGPTTTHPPNEERETEIAYLASFILSGGHLKAVDEPFIDRVVFGLTGLEEWCNTTGFSGNFKRSQVPPRPPKGKLADESVDVFFQNSSTEFFNIGHGRRLRFLSLYSGPEHFNREKVIELKEKTKIEIAFAKHVSINQALDEIRIWQTFISFGLRIPTFLDGIAVLQNRSQRVKRMESFVSERKWEAPNRGRYHRLALFNQSKLGATIGKRLKAWRQKQEVVDMAVLLFRGAAYLEDVYIHTNTLTYLQALEVFHRQMYKGNKFPNAPIRRSTLKALREAIPKNIDLALQRELKEGLSFVGSPSLLERLKQLFYRYPKCLKPLFPNGDEDMALLKNVRNFLTHYGDTGQLTKEYMFSPDVFWLGEKARLFLEVCLLGVMGMTDNEILELLKDFAPYADWCREARMRTATTSIAGVS